MRHHLALVVCLAFTASVVDAAPRRHGKASKQHADKKKRAKREIAPPDESSERSREDSDRDSDRVAFRSETIDDDQLENVDSVEDEDSVEDVVDDERAEVDAPVRIRKTAKPRAKNWHVAIGPYLWASSVDADVSLGSSTVSAGVDFFELKRHARFGAEVLAEARYDRFAIYGDVLYGVVGVSGEREVGPLMVTLAGSASTLLVDGLAGYMLAGSDHEVVSLEVRGGVRYQRTAIAGALNVADNEVMAASHVDAAADALAGARVAVRPFERMFVSGSMDVGVVGDSSLTWSAAADAGVRITKHTRLSLGWRTLTTTRTNLSIVMHGPRAAFQVMF